MDATHANRLESAKQARRAMIDYRNMCETCRDITRARIADDIIAHINALPEVSEERRVALDQIAIDHE